MSREQRRMDRRQPPKPAQAPLNRRTPVKARGSRRPPWVPIAIAAAMIAVFALIAYVILQSAGGAGGLSAAAKAEQDSSPDLPGVFTPSQGRGHFPFTYSRERSPTPFCDGVERSGASGTPAGSATAASTATAQATATPQPSATSATAPATSGSTTPVATPKQRTDCYNSNPPSSGMHLGVQRNVDFSGTGTFLGSIPPDPNVYNPDVIIPREAIAHILEHAGVFVGYNCAAGDQACLDVVEKMKTLVNDRIDNYNDRVVMANDPDLPEGEIGVSAWTRVLNMNYQDYDERALESFISKHACRFDPENFCR